MATPPQNPSQEGIAIEQAAFDATFHTVQRTMAIGLLTGVLVVGGLLVLAEVPTWQIVAYLIATGFCRFGAIAISRWGLRQTALAEQRKAMTALECTLVPIGALSSLAIFLPAHPAEGVSPVWFGLLLSAGFVPVANILIGHGRARTFLALVVPVLGLAVIGCLSIGTEYATLLAFGAAAVGAILIFTSREAGLLFRQARLYEFRNRTLVLDLEAANTKLLHMARTDLLTGIDNRTGLELRLAALAERNNNIAVAFVDLDDFKSINDHYGHSVGDEVLRVVALRLRGIVRSHDDVIRMGGDEFLLLLQLDATEDAESVNQRLQTCFHDPIRANETTLHISASVGIVPADPNDDLAAMVDQADQAMYSQKRKRRVVNVS